MSKSCAERRRGGGTDQRTCERRRSVQKKKKKKTCVECDVSRWISYCTAHVLHTICNTYNTYPKKKMFFVSSRQINN